MVAEFELPASWVGKTVREVDARRLYHLNIIGYRLKKISLWKAILPQTLSGPARRQHYGCD